MALEFSYRLAKRIAVAVVGTSVLLIGIVMLIAPGPAFIVIPLGLAILGVEFAWARAWLKRVRQAISRRSATQHGERAEARRNS